MGLGDLAQVQNEEVESLSKVMENENGCITLQKLTVPWAKSAQICNPGRHIEFQVFPSVSWFTNIQLVHVDHLHAPMLTHRCFSGAMTPASCEEEAAGPNGARSGESVGCFTCFHIDPVVFMVNRVSLFFGFMAVLDISYMIL